jgi:hypothetical protein
MNPKKIYESGLPCAGCSMEKGWGQVRGKTLRVCAELFSNREESYSLAHKSPPCCKAFGAIFQYTGCFYITVSLTDRTEGI